MNVHSVRISPTPVSPISLEAEGKKEKALVPGARGMKLGSLEVDHITNKMTGMINSSDYTNELGNLRHKGQLKKKTAGICLSEQQFYFETGFVKCL